MLLLCYYPYVKYIDRWQNNSVLVFDIIMYFIVCMRMPFILYHGDYDIALVWKIDVHAYMNFIFDRVL